MKIGTSKGTVQKTHMTHNLWIITYGLRKTERDFKFERYICARPIFANYGMIGMCRTEIWRKTS